MKYLQRITVKAAIIISLQSAKEITPEVIQEAILKTEIEMNSAGSVVVNSTTTAYPRVHTEEIKP